MNDKEVLFFIGRCLTINHDDENKKIVSDQISRSKIDWDKVVQVSTSHYVFPVLYINLKHAKLLSYLPEELVNYMEHITGLNRERNLEIINQAKEINIELRKNGIAPIFLKGTAFLIQGFYSDPAERMVGDIDFLVDANSFDLAVELLKDQGYEKTSQTKHENPVISKHYPRLFHKNKIAAVEVHLNMVRGNLSNHFNYDSCSDMFLSNSYTFLGLEDQLALCILAKQHNDYGSLFKTVNLRSYYDVFLLSRKVSFIQLKSRFTFFEELLNPFLAIAAQVLQTKSISFDNNLKSKKFVIQSLKKVELSNYGKKHTKWIKTKIYLQLKIKGLIRFITNKEFRMYYTKKLLNL